MAWAPTSKEKELKEAYERHDIAAIFTHIRSHMPKVARELTRMAWPSGILATSYAKSREVFREYFRTLFDGEVSSFKSLLETDRCSLCEHCDGQGLPDLDPAIISTWEGLAGRLSHTKQFKGVGEDLIGGEVLRRFPNIMSSLFTPLALKSTALISTLFQFKGGCLQELYKKSRVKSKPTSYRDVMLAREVGKTLAADIRPEIVKQVAVVAVPTQYGSGLNSGSTDVGHLYVKACIDVAAAAKDTFAALFVDIKTTFASLVRALSLPMAGDSTRRSAYMDRVVQNGFSREDALEIVSEIIEDEFTRKGFTVN